MAVFAFSTGATTLQIVYLDQNKWIKLARVRLGRDRSQRLAEVLEIMTAARDMQLACFPLSAGHYMETQKHRNPRRREELSAFMQDISGGATIANASAILKYEIDQALYRRFPHRVSTERIESLALLGHGISHASGRREFKYAPPDMALAGQTAKARTVIEAQLNRLFELAMLSGVNPVTGEPAPLADLSGPDTNFKEHLNALAEKLQGANPELRERTLYAISTADIWDELAEALSRHRIPLEEFARAGEKGIMEFIDDLPTRRVDIHLHRQWASNPQLRADLSELNDWGQVAPMVMYCDVVVTEKQLADLLGRGAFQHRATVLTDLQHLPGVLLKS